MKRFLLVVSLQIAGPTVFAFENKCADIDSLELEIKNQKNEIDSLKSQLKDPEYIYKNALSVLLDGGTYKSVKEADDAYKEKYELKVILKVLDDHLMILNELASRGIKNKDIERNVKALISEIDKEKMRLVKKQGQKDAVTGIIELGLQNKDDEEVFSDMVTLSLELTNHTQKSIVGARVRVKIFNKLKKVLFNKELEADWTIEPLSSSSGGIVWTFKDNPFINGEAYDILFSVAKSGNYEYNVDIMEAIYE